MNRYFGLIMLVLAIPLTGCQKEWHILITDMNNPGYPTFCVSKHKSYCTSGGIDLPILAIEEVDGIGHAVGEGKVTTPMWIIEPSTNSYLDVVKYGQTPDGWKEVQPAKPLQIGQWYTVNEQAFFRINWGNGEFQADILTLDEFLGMVHSERE